MPRVFADPLRERLGRYALILGLDAVLAATSLHAAMGLRFDGAVPGPWAAIMPRAVALVVAVRLAANLGARLHCWSFRLAGLPDAVRIATGATTGSALLVLLAPWLIPPGLPRTVYALEFFMSSSAFAVARFGPLVAARWWGERRRRASGAAPTLLVGVNFAAELLARDIVRSPQRRYDLVGFVGSDPAEVGRRIDGKPILGVVKDLAALIERHRVAVVLLAIPRPAAASLRRIIAVCATLRVQFKILPAFSSLADPVSAAMLDDVAAGGPPAAPAGGVRPGRAAAARGRTAGARHRRRRLDRRRDLPAARPLRRPPARHGRHERERAVPPRPAACRGAAGGRRPRRGRRRPRARPDRAARRALPPRGRLPRRRAQARAAHGGRPRRGGEEQRVRDAPRRPHGRRLRRASGSSSSPPTRR